MSEKREGDPRVLVVDDTPATRYAIVRVLRHAGFEVIEAENGTTALKLAKDSQLVCLDVQLPDISGFEVCARLKSDPATSSIPVVHVTASYADDLSMARGLEGGADAYLTLPVEPHVLVATLHALLRLRETERDLQTLLAREVEARRAAEQGRSRLEFLARATAELAGSLEHDETVSRAVQVSVPEFADVSVLWMLEEPGRLTRVAAHASDPAVLAGFPTWVGTAVDAPGPGAVLATGAHLRIEKMEDRIARTASGADFAGTLLGAGIGSGIWIRLTSGDTPTGVISFLRKAGREPFADADVLVAQQLANGVCTALQNARLYGEVRQSDRAKEAFLTMLAHELRNPLEPILTAAHLLGRPELDPRAADRARAIVLRQTRQMSRLVDDLLDVSRVNTGKIELRKELLELNALVNDTSEDYRAQLENQGLTLEVRLSPSEMPIHADGARVRQALGNFLHNAAKFTAPGGKITIETRRENGKGLVLVRDTGIGMDEETLAKLFTPFVQADRSYDRSRGGLGLGLAVAKGLVTLHGGDIEVTSEGNGKGTEVRVTLPLDETGRLAALPRPERVRPRPLKILIAEDSYDAASALRDFLELGGHTVAVEGTGTGALDAARTFLPDVVICDLGLPGLDGYEVARALRCDPATASAHLVALSGYAQVEDRRRSSEVGFEEHLAKPIDPRDLESLLAGLK